MDLILIDFTALQIQELLRETAPLLLLSLSGFQFLCDVPLLLNLPKPSKRSCFEVFLFSNAAHAWPRCLILFFRVSICGSSEGPIISLCIKALASTAAVDSEILVKHSETIRGQSPD
ncbi:hypothetical protein ILYODFUR_002570 [Ilyodon furcidens]|uniref:Uncharacterized protein n=1 Tax=Ilyodon furcidens TaxID=33524 RepID=A0ABV0UD69_9TELE